MTKRLFALVLTVVMVLSMLPTGVWAEGVMDQSKAAPHTHCTCGAGVDCAEAANNTAGHKIVTFEAWNTTGAAKTKLPESTTDGEKYYYLENGMTTKSEARIKSGHVFLCLNHQTVTAGGTANAVADRLYYLNSSGNVSVTILDCTATGTGDTYAAGTMTGATASAIMSDNTTTGGSINIYDGIFADNSRANGGGAINAQGKTTVNIYGGYFKDNKASSRGGGAICLLNAANTAYIENATFSGNEANGAGVIYANANLTLKDVTIQNNKTKGDSATYGLGAVSMIPESGKALTLMGNTKIISNTDGVENSTVKRNVELRGNKIVVDNTFAATSSIGLTITDGKGAFTDALSNAESVKGSFTSDNTAYVVDVADNKLVLVENKEHKDATHVCEHCDSTLTWTPWGDDANETNLPTAKGHYYLTRNMDVQKEDLSADVVLCLNGKTVTCNGEYNKGSDRFYYLKGTGSITITDCTASGEGDDYKAGKFTGASASAIMSDGGTTGGSINIYDGIFTGNWRSSSGGALCVQGKTTLNIKGGQFIDNSTNNSGGVIYLNGSANTTYIEKAVFKGNHANGTAGVLHSNYGAKITIKDTVMTGNYAAGAGVILSSGALTLENVQITGNRTVSGDYGAVALVKDNAKTVTVKGNTQITGNTYGDENATGQRNLYLVSANTTVAVNNPAATAKIGMSAAEGVPFTGALTDAESIKGYFGADDENLQVAVQDSKLVLEPKVVEPEHDDAIHVCEHCDSTLTWTPWGDDANETNLPTAKGHYYLTRNMDVQKEDLSADVVLCLNGKTVTCNGEYNKGSDRFYYLRGNGTITITDCTATGEGDSYKAGTITGASASGIMSDGGTTGGSINIYDGIFTGNWRSSSGGALCVQGKTVLNIYGGQFTDNSSNSGAGVIYLGSSNNTAHIEGALFKNNHATGTAGVIHNNFGAKITVKDTVMTGNYAANAGVILSSGALTLENVQITGNRTVSGDYGAVALVKNNAKYVTAKGNTQITNNTYGDASATEQRNLYLEDPATKIAVDSLATTAKVGITATSDVALTDALTDAEAVKGYFASDDVQLKVIAQASKLYLTSANPDHPHNLCGKDACEEHLLMDFTKWDKTDSLPTSGTISLQNDVVLSAQVDVAGKLSICLNGHTITVNKADTRAFSLDNGDVLNITDCQGTGKITGGSRKYGGAIQVSRSAVLNLFAGAISGNSALTEEGGAVYIGGGNDSVKAGGIFNMYGGEICDNYARQGTAVRLTNPSGAGNTAQFNMYGGKITGNEADTNGSVIYAGKATVRLLGGEISGNTAGSNGTIYAGADIDLTIGDCKITGNTAGNGGGVYVSSKSATVKLSGDVTILGNTAGNKANNVFLNSDAIVTLGTLAQTAKVGLGVAIGNRIVSGENDVDYSANFLSDSVYKKITYQNKVLHIAATADHSHCLCTNGSKGCDHTAQAWQAWDGATSLPTAEGNFYLTEDVVVSGITQIDKKTNICLNGHTVSVKEGKTMVRLFSVSANAELTLTDCQGTGKLTGGNRTYGSAVNIAKDGTFNLYGGTITGNVNEDASGGMGTIYAGGENSVVNVYGGQICGNTAIYGGAIYGVTKAIINVYGGQISDNEAVRGGAIYGTTISIDGAAIRGNKAVTLMGTDAEGKEVTKMSASGGAIYGSAGATTIKNAVIEGNTSSSSAGAIMATGKNNKLTITGTTIKDNHGDGYAGGAILAQTTGTEVNITDSQFIGNTIVSNGGAIYTSYDTSLNVDSTTFTGNTAEKGACIYSERTKINLGKVIMEKNIATTTKEKPTLRAAGVFAAGGELNVDGAIIRDNYAISNGVKKGCIGVAIATSYSDQSVKGEDGKTTKVRHYATVNFNSGTVSGNQASSGAIYLNSKTVFNMKSGEIKNNSGSSEGGGFYINNDSVFTMTGGTISGNSAKLNGGGIMAVRATLNLKGGAITGNTATKSGAGVQAPGCKVYLSGTSVTYNKATGSGGGVVTSISKADGRTYIAHIIMTGGRVANNESKNGGGILHQGNGSIFELRGGTIANNVSKGDGGGIFVSTNTTFKMSGATITGNQAAGRGGAVHHLNSKGEYTGGLITDNRAENTAGGVQVGNSEVTIRNVTFRDNVGVKFGGTIQINGTIAHAYIENVEISGSSSETGGAVYIGNNLSMEMVNCKISDCSAVKNGGAIFLGNNTTIKLENITLENNEAGGAGGAIMNRSGNAVSKELTFIGNKAAENGGALMLLRPALQGVSGSSNYKVGFVLDGAVFRDNESKLQGGAVHVDAASKCIMSDIVMENNKAALEGGAVYAAGETTMDGLSATGNSSENGGYAVYLADSLYDGQSYITGIMSVGGDMIVKDNQGGDMYMGELTTAAVLRDKVGEKTEMHITLASGVLTNKLFGTYHYEGGDQVYTVTYGDRSIIEPEYDESLVNKDQQKSNFGDVLLYAGIGVFVLAIAAVVALLILKKKKKAPVADGASE